MQTASTNLAGTVGSPLQQVVDYQKAAASADAAQAAADSVAVAALHTGIAANNLAGAARLSAADQARVSADSDAGERKKGRSPVIDVPLFSFRHE